MTLTRRSFALGSMAACAFTALPSHAAAIRLRVNATPSTFKSMFQQLVLAFEKKHPGLTVALNASLRDQAYQLQNTLRRSLIDDLPDVSFEGMPSLPTLRTRRIAVPLESFIANDPEWTRATYDDSLTEIGRVGTSIMALGVAVSLPIIYYNADRVSPALGSKPFPQQWPDIVTLVERLARQAKPGELGGYCQHPRDGWLYMAMIESAGGRLQLAPDNPTVFDCPQSLHALEIYRAFGRAGQARAIMASGQARQAFVGGTIAVLVDSSSSLATLERQIDGRFRLGTARIPMVPGGRVPVSGICSVMMTRDLARQRAAWEFMKFVASPQGQIIIGKSSGYFPANAEAVRRAEWLGSHYESRPLARAVTESMPFAARQYDFPGKNSAKIYSVISEHVESVITLSSTPAEALASMKRSVEALLPPRAA